MESVSDFGARRPGARPPSCRSARGRWSSTGARERRGTTRYFLASGPLRGWRLVARVRRPACSSACNTCGAARSYSRPSGFRPARLSAFLQPPKRSLTVIALGRSQVARAQSVHFGLRPFAAAQSCSDAVISASSHILCRSLRPASERKVALCFAAIEARVDARLVVASGVRRPAVSDDVDVASVHRHRHAAEPRAQTRVQLAGPGARGVRASGKLFRRPALDRADQVELASDPAGRRDSFQQRSPRARLGRAALQAHDRPSPPRRHEPHRATRWRSGESTHAPSNVASSCLHRLVLLALEKKPVDRRREHRLDEIGVHRQRGQRGLPLPPRLWLQQRYRRGTFRRSVARR